MSDLYNTSWVEELGTPVEYTLDEIFDDISFNASFSGNEGCYSEEELRDLWISRLFDALVKEQKGDNKVRLYD